MARKGILGEKVGMTQVFDDGGLVVPVTVVRAGPCPVTQVRTRERDGYDAVQLGYGRARRATRPLAGHFAKAGVEPTRHLVEIRLDGGDGADGLGPGGVGDLVTVAVFRVGEKVDVTAKSKGKGYTGVMKRHGFGGLGASHGAHKVHRAPGSIGACATPARVFPGTRMAGRAGGTRVTIQSLELVGVDPERDLLLIKGAVPGSNGSLVVVRDAVKAKATSGDTTGDGGGA